MIKQRFSEFVCSIIPPCGLELVGHVVALVLGAMALRGLSMFSEMTFRSQITYELRSRLCHNDKSYII